jgi:formylglycine-generating enzyme required for sulfatase activity
VHRLLALASLLVALPAGAVTIDWVPIGNAGNPADTAANCYAADCGSVAHAYHISKYEVTNAQYAEFLNAVAATDPFGLYGTNMGSNSKGGITRSGSDGSYVYAVKPGFENRPVVFVTSHHALRFANWLANGQGSGDTETGSYTITANGLANNSITRNEAAATVVLPSESEWYKAAYYSPGGTYFDYPTRTDTETSCIGPAGDTGNSANCESAVLTDAGAYALSASPYGTFDQGGNVWEWNEQIYFTARGLRGGGWNGLGAGYLAASSPSAGEATFGSAYVGFRVARVAPEPARVLLALTGGLVLAAVRLRRRE